MRIPRISEVPAGLGLATSSRRVASRAGTRFFAVSHCFYHYQIEGGSSCENRINTCIWHPSSKDLAVILAVAAIVTLIFQRIEQPVALGYIIASILVGPGLRTSTVLISDLPNIQVWADLGVIFLMFSIRTGVQLPADWRVSAFPLRSRPGARDGVHDPAGIPGRAIQRLARLKPVSGRDLFRFPRRRSSSRLMDELRVRTAEGSPSGS